MYNLYKMQCFFIATWTRNFKSKRENYWTDRQFKTAVKHS